MSTDIRAALEQLIGQARYVAESGDTSYLLTDIAVASAALATEPVGGDSKFGANQEFARSPASARTFPPTRSEFHA